MSKDKIDRTINVFGFFEVKRWVGILIITVVIILALAGLFRATFVSFVDNYELGFTHNRFSGEIKKLDRTGYFVYMPFKWSVHSVDLRPYQISITASFGSETTTSGIPSRVLNAKLVKFNEEGLSTFVEWHGLSAGDALSNLKEIMKAYAFDKEEGKDCPFITVLSEISPSQTPEQ